MDVPLVAPAVTEPRDLRGLFLRQCARFGSAVAYTVLADDLSVASAVTFSALESRVLSLASALADRCRPGDRVLLALDNGLDSAELFWASIVAGLVPVPAPAPHQSGNAGFRRLNGIVEDSGAALVVSAPEHRAAFAHLAATWTSRAALGADTAATQPPDACISSHDLAYLQYTSGSTSDPRGVELTHGNVLWHCAALACAMEADKAPTSILSWLPWFHDFGLLQGVISPIYLGITSYLMPTTTFMRRPLSWLDAIGKYRISYSGAPDTGFLACVKALSRKSGWTGDLSSWSLAISGGEPVRAETVASFTRAFAPYGFRAESFAPAYGMAEAVLALSIKREGEPPLVLALDAAALEAHQARDAEPGGARPHRTLVGCGPLLGGLDVRVVEPERGEERAPGEIGEIWVSGPSIGRGYWGKRDLSKETFGARLASQGKAGRRYLRTGDLGFVRDGQLVLTGRLKDIILVNGRNLYPHDIELTVHDACPAVRASGVIAFGIERSGGEAVVVLVERAGRPDPDADRDLVERIRSAVGAEHGVEVHDVVLLKRGALPQTSSGKPRRSAAKQGYLNGDYGEAAGRRVSEAEPGRAPGDALERTVAEAWMAVLNLDHADIDADFFLMGGNSLSATQLVSRLNAALGADLPVRAVFEAPTIAGLAQRLRETASDGRAARLEGPVEGGGKAAGNPLSFSQERFWFVSQQVPESTAYHMSLALRFKGALDVAALEAALARIVERHEILRTTFAASPAGVEVRVQPDLPIRIQKSRLDAPGAASGGADAGLDRHLTLLLQEPFDLGRGPLIRARFVEIAADDGVLLVVMHHIIGDQWSFAVLARELAHFYRAAIGKGEAALPALPLQYADFAAWQRQTFDRDRRGHEEAYWIKQLEGLEPASIPADFPRPSRALHRGAQVRVPLDPRLIAKLTELGARHSASLSMVLMTALNILLARYTGRGDISIGLSVAGRNRDWSEALIGPLVNVLVQRTEVDRTLDFPALLERVRQNALDAFTHQEMPFDQLVSKLKHRRDASRAPLFQVLFNMVNVPVGKVDFDGAQVSLVNFDRRSAQFDLSVMVDAEHDLSISFEYGVQVFQRDTVERLAAHYMRLLEDVADAEARPVAQLAPMPRAEIDEVLAFGRGVDRPLPAETVPDWLGPAFGQWADKTAVVFEDEALSYRALDLASTAVARALSARGLGRGHRVGLHVTRSAGMIAALLGVLKSGAAYVPLDAANPPQRLNSIVRDAGLDLIVVDSAEDAAPIWMGTTPTLGLAGLVSNNASDPAAGVAAPDTTQRDRFDVRAEDPAYVLYTSGSTGEPKGVQVSHRSLVNLLSSLAAEPGLSSSDKMLAITTLSFDISTVETLLPLGVGASIVVAGRGAVADGEALLRLIERHEVSVVQATPSTWHLLIKAGWSGSPSLRKAMVGGEPLPQSLAVDLVARCGEVWNLYGPTETTVWSTVGRVENPQGRLISIGRPIANTQVYVLDSELRPCPIGVEGDLYIGGIGVSQGYVNLPDLTAERFLPDPFAPHDAAARIYRTGDRARWRNDGTLAHLGRSDTQVKLRGYRVELSEIEAHLVRHPQVACAAATVREVAPGDQRLVAFVVPRGSGLSVDALRQYLSRFVPAYMLPQSLSLVEALPLLASGKVDSKRLASLPLEAPSSRAITPPRTPDETAVWAIWRDILGVEHFGVDDNFFDLGGHSMLAVRVVNRVQAEVDRTCTISMLFQHPTIAELAGAMRGSAQVETPLAVALQELGETPPLFCICGIHIYQELANHLAPHRQVYALFVPTEIGILNGDVELGALSVEAIAADYIKEIRKKQPSGPYHLAGLSFGGLLAFEIAQQLRREGEEIAFVAMFDTIMPMGRFEIAARRMLHHARGLSWAGVLPALALGRSRLSEAVARARKKPEADARSGDRGQADEARLTAVRDAIYRRAARRYKARAYDGAVVLVHAEDSKIPDTTPLWRRVIGNLEVLSVPGDHLGILKAPYVGAVAQHILAGLNRR
jgi:amino acid adenylation domain-containing protein